MGGCKDAPYVELPPAVSALDRSSDFWEFNLLQYLLRRSLLVPIIHELYARAVPIMGWLGAPGEFPVTLQWLYAASLIYALAILLYQVFCPSEIKRHAHPEDYTRSQYDIFQRADPQRRINVVLARLHPVDDSQDRSRIEKNDID